MPLHFNNKCILNNIADLHDDTKLYQKIEACSGLLNSRVFQWYYTLALLGILGPVYWICYGALTKLRSVGWEGGQPLALYTLSPFAPTNSTLVIMLFHDIYVISIIIYWLI